MNAPAECKDCAGLMRCTSSGEETDRCVNTRNPHGFVSAAICKSTVYEVRSGKTWLHVK